MKHQKPAVVRNLVARTGKSFARVHYQKEGSGGFLIVQFEAFKTGREIAEAYGIVAYENYLLSASWMRMEDDGACLVTSIDGAMNGLRPGHVMDKETFTKIIGTIKKCGNSLGEAIRNSPKKPTIRVIEI